MDTARSQFVEWVASHEETQAGVAKLLGCSTAMVTHLLSGRRSPGLRTAISIERLSGIPAASWLEEVAA